MILEFRRLTIRYECNGASTSASAGELRTKRVRWRSGRRPDIFQHRMGYTKSDQMGMVLVNQCLVGHMVSEQFINAALKGLQKALKAMILWVAQGTTGHVEIRR